MGEVDGAVMERLIEIAAADQHQKDRITGKI